MTTSALSVRPARQLAGSNGPPLVGETFSFLKSPEEFVQARVRRYGRIFRTRLFGKSVAVLVGAEANRFVLVDGMPSLRWKDGWPPTFPELLGDALFFDDGPEHLRKRKLLMPAFQTEAIERYLPTMEALLRNALERWTKMGSFAWYDQFHRLTFEVAGTLFLGSELGADVERLNRLFDRWVSGLVAPPIPLPWTAFGRARRVRRDLLAHVETMIDHRKRTPSQDALGLLVGYRDEQGESLSVEELRSQALFLVAVGYATTTSMLTYLAYALATHEEVLDRARAEQRELDLTGPITLDALKRMSYLDQVITEVERRFPPVGFGFRGVAEPVEFAGYEIPQGWQVMYSITGTHFDPEYYPEPQRFDPDRFADGAPSRSSYRLVGFGGGPRVCMGMNLARTQIKLIASHLLRGYRWTVVPKQDLSVVVMPARRPKSGLKVDFKPL